MGTKKYYYSFSLPLLFFLQTLLKAATDHQFLLTISIVNDFSIDNKTCCGHRLANRFCQPKEVIICMETATAIRTCFAPAISSKILMYLFAQLNCKMRLQIVKNWNVNMFFMDGRFFNCINLKTINEAIKKSSIHKKKKLPS